MKHSCTYSPDDNKIRIYPAHRLDADEYARVKAAGFKWAPRQQLFVAPTWSPGREDLAIAMCGEIGDEDTSLVDRAEERADRFENYSDKRLADAERARKAVAEIADNIPLGQPILLGHHSEKHARRDQEKIQNGMRKAVKMWETSQYWTARAAGALQHAKYKELPTVRHRRIKTIEAEHRKVTKERAEAERQLKAWQAVAGINDPEKQRAAGLHVANVGGYWSLSFPLADYPRDPPASQYEGPMGLWSAIDGGVITPAQAAAIAIPGLERSLPRKDRWLAHYDNRLAYERAMLAEQIGGEATANPLADRFAFAVGGQVLVGRRTDEWLTVVKVSKGTNGSVSSVQTAAPEGARGRGVYWKVESVRDYRPPTAENVAAAKAATKLPPICNYPGEGFREMTEAEWNKRNKFSDFPYIGRVAASDTHGAHRRRQMPKPGEYWKAVPVFITDAKRVDPPKIVPPSEPKEPAEFVREFVAPPDADLDATLATVAEIMAEAPACGTVPVENARPLAEYGGPAVKVSCRGCKASFSIPRAWLPYNCDDCGTPCCEDAAESVNASGDGIAPPAAADLPAPSPTADFEAMRQTLRNGGVQVVVAPQLFPTPAGLAEEAAELAGLQPGDRLLEPSAGTGMLLDVARRSVDGDLQVVAVEINHQLADSLSRRFPGVTVINADFMDMVGVTADAKFDKILMNPPFERGADIRHIEHARTMLKPGGRLVAICANGPRQRERLQPIASEWRDLPAGTFKAAGTMVNVALLAIDAPPG